jgi:hypothetical protein
MTSTMKFFDTKLSARSQTPVLTEFEHLVMTSFV